MHDAVMVADMSDSAERQAGGHDAEAEAAPSRPSDFPVDHRPWGWFETLVLADRFQVKRIHVHPGATL